jgi:hypothetical protein
VEKQDLWKYVDEGNLVPGDEPPKRNSFIEFVHDNPMIVFVGLIVGLIAWTHFGGSAMDRFIKWATK